MAKKKQKEAAAAVVELDAPSVSLDDLAEKAGRHPPDREFKSTGTEIKDYPAGPLKQVHVNRSAINWNRSRPPEQRYAPLIIRVDGHEAVEAWEVEFLDPTTLVYSQDEPLASFGCGDSGTVSWIETTGEVRAVLKR